MTTEFTARGDPQRSLDVLWGTARVSVRGPKPGLSVKRILRAAIDSADADGLATLSRRRVAERLGVGAMSLYTYIPGKAEILERGPDGVEVFIHRRQAEQPAR
jgi:hypothetical protein